MAVHHYAVEMTSQQSCDPKSGHDAFVMQARIADLEENSVALETRVEEAEGNLAAAQIEAETAIAELDRRVADLNADHSEALASLEATKESEVSL